MSSLRTVLEKKTKFSRFGQAQLTLAPYKYMENITTRSSMYDPLNNFFFYKTFGEKGDEVQLLGFINAVLGKSAEDSFTSVEILENKSFMADIMGGKSCILDVRARLKNGAMVNIEVQLRDQYNMDRRSLFYLSKEYTRELKSGDDYIELPDVIAINIVNFDFPHTGNFHSCFHLREDTEREIVLTKALEIHFINMVKYRKHGRKNQDRRRLNDPLYRQLVWFDKNSPPKLLEEVVKMDAAIKAADSRMTHITQDCEEMLSYERYMKYECDRTSEMNFAVSKGRMEGREEGRIEGREERDFEIARNLIAEGSTLEFVQKITGLDMKTIRKLK